MLYVIYYLCSAGAHSTCDLANIAWHSASMCSHGLLLGGMAEDALIFTYQISGGMWSYLLERPVTIFILVMLVISLFGGKLVSMLTKKVKQ